MINKRILDDMMSLNDEEFVNKAYEKVLKRLPDNQGKEAYILSLKNGLTRERMIFELLFSDEGFSKNNVVEDFNIKTIEAERLYSINRECIIDALFVVLLGRTPTEYEKHKYNSLGERKTLDQLITLLLRTDEGKKLNINIINREKCKRDYRKQKVFSKNDKHIVIQESPKQEIDVTRESLLSELYDKAQASYQKAKSRKNVSILNKVLESPEYEKYISNKDETYDSDLNMLKPYLNTLTDKSVVVLNNKKWLDYFKENYNAYFIFINDNQSFDLSDCNIVDADYLSYIKNVQTNSLDVISISNYLERLDSFEVIELLSYCKNALRKNGLLIIEAVNPKDNTIYDLKMFNKIPYEAMEIIISSLGFNNIKTINNPLYITLANRGKI